MQLVLIHPKLYHLLTLFIFFIISIPHQVSVSKYCMKKTGFDKILCTFCRDFLSHSMSILYKYLSKIEKISLIYSLLLIDKYAINQSAFYIPLTIVLFMNFSSLYLKQKAKYLKNFYQSIIVYLIMIPFLASFNNSLNLLTFLLISHFYRFLSTNTCSYILLY